MKEQNKSMKSLYPTAFVLYLSFFVHGFGAAILSQNTKSFQVLWNTDAVKIELMMKILSPGLKASAKSMKS